MIHRSGKMSDMAHDIHGYPRDHLVNIVVFVAYSALGFRFFRIIYRHAVNIFTWDQWGFNDATLFQQHSLWEVFRWQWGPHREGIGGVLSKVLEPLSRWNSRYEDFGVGTIIFLAAVLALFLKRRLFRSIAYEDVIIPLFFLTPAQYETLIEAEGPTPMSLPLLLTMLYCFSWTIESYWKYLYVLLTNVLLIYTGYGVFIGFLTPCLIVADYYLNARHQTRVHEGTAATSFFISILSLLSFFVGYKVLPTMGCPAPQATHALSYFWFVDLMFATFVGVKADGPGRALVLAILVGGILLLSALIAMLFFVRRLLKGTTPLWNINVVVSALLGYSLLFCLNAAFGRQCLGLRIAESSRYATLLIPAFFGLYLGALSMHSRNWRVTYVSLLFAVSLLSSAPIRKIDDSAINKYSSGKRAWRECYLELHNIQQCDARVQFRIIPRLDTSFVDEQSLQQKLDFLEQNHLNLYSDVSSASTGPPNERKGH